MNPTANVTPFPTATNDDRDAAGYAVFNQGDLGRMHVLAHRLADEGRPAAGIQVLRPWLDSRSGQGSEWVHLQWHLAVFEIAVGDIRRAYARYRAHIRPAVAADQALTDAPAMLWRLQRAGARVEGTDWSAVAEVARRRLDDESDRYVTLHHLLALAGAGDLETIRTFVARPDSHPVLAAIGSFLIHQAGRHYDAALERLEVAVAGMAEVGGSHAQNALLRGLLEDTRFMSAVDSLRRAA